MTEILVFDQSHPVHGVFMAAPGVRRVVARNAGPFTFTGTVTHIVGEGQVAIIDPGPDDAEHLANILKTIRNETISHILVSHTHRDHTGALNALKQATGATVAGCAAYSPSRALHAHERNPLEASNDLTYRPDVELADGETVTGPGWALRAVATPGHTANHLSFSLESSGLLFSGDHVMGWSSTIVAPPDGSMKDYMASLERLLMREDRLYLPAHGSAIHDPRRHVEALRRHRLTREAAIRARLVAGDRTVEDIVGSVYRGLDPRLVTGASLSVLAHLEDLIERGLARCDGPPRLDGVFTFA